MKANLEKTVSYILESEGPEFNRGGSEPGGGSKYGVSLTAYREVAAHATLDDLSRLTRQQAFDFYATHILPQVRFDDLPSGVDYRLADIRVNLGQTGATTLVELIVQRWPMTGKFDDALSAWLQSHDPKAVILLLSTAWIAKKRENVNWNPSPITKTGYGHGWTNRNIAATAQALALVK